jgi:hypothetical protein
VMGTEVSTPTSLTRASLRRGGDGRARAPRGPLALHGRHDSVAVCPTEWSPTWWSDSSILSLIISQTSENQAWLMLAML